jgi:hypothetical protein
MKACALRKTKLKEKLIVAKSSVLRFEKRESVLLQGLTFFRKENYEMLLNDCLLTVKN